MKQISPVEWRITRTLHTFRELPEASCHTQACWTHAIGYHEDQIPLASMLLRAMLAMCFPMVQNCKNDNCGCSKDRPNQKGEVLPEARFPGCSTSSSCSKKRIIFSSCTVITVCGRWTLTNKKWFVWVHCSFVLCLSG